MKTQDLYNKAQKNGAVLECTCVDIPVYKWEELMKNATKADRIVSAKIALMANVITEDDYKRSIKNPYYNPYQPLKTKTHLIYIHSAIEHFILIN